MSILFADGFDTYANDYLQLLGRWTESGTSVVIDVSSGRNGGGRAKCLNEAAGKIRTSTFGAVTTIFVQGAFRVSGYSNIEWNPVIRLRNGAGADIFTVSVRGSTVQGQLTCREGGTTGTVRGTATTLLGTGAWVHLALKVVIHASAGSVDLKVNGVSEVSVSGVDTEGATGGCESVVFYGDGSGSSFFGYVDDVVIYDASGSFNNDWLGDAFVQPFMPDADTADADFIPSSGSNLYPMIDEAQADGDTTYIEGTTPGERSLFAFSPSVPAGSVVIGLNVFTQDKGGGDMQIRCRSGSDEDTSATITTDAATYKSHSQIFESDPATGDLWDESTLLSAEFGVEIV